MLALMLPTVPSSIANASSYEYELEASGFKLHPLILLNSPYDGSASATNKNSIEWNFGSLVGYQSEYTSGTTITASNGASNGVFRLQKIGIYKVYEKSCFLFWCHRTYIGEIAEPISGTAQFDVSLKIAPEGTLSDVYLPTQVSYDGYDSVSFDIRYHTKDYEYIVPAGSSSMVKSVNEGSYFDANINLGVSINGVSVSGLLRFGYTSGSTSEYTYVLDSDPYSDRIWYVDYLGDYDIDHNEYPLIWAFEYIGSGGGGGCPFIAINSGNKYVLFNNLLPQMELFNRSKLDVIDSLLLPAHMFKMKGNNEVIFDLVEREHSIDYINNIMLYSVQLTDSSYHLAIGPNGTLYAFKQVYLPIESRDGNGTDILNLITNNSNYYTGYDNDYILVNLPAEGNSLVISIKDLVLIKSPVNVYIKTMNNEWKKIAVIMPRANWTTYVVPLVNYDHINTSVKLVFTAKTEVKLVGMTTITTQPIKVKRLHLISAILNNGVNVKHILLNSRKHVSLYPGDNLTLAFRGKINNASGFLVKAKGLYVDKAYYDSNNKSNGLAWYRYHNIVYILPVLNSYDNIVKIDWYLDNHKLNISTEILHMIVGLHGNNEHTITAIIHYRDMRNVRVQMSVQGLNILRYW